MENSDPHQLGDADRDSVLGRGGVGVLAFSTGTDTPPHSVPVSYGYDPETASLYFRLATGGDRTKSDLVGRPASFTVHQEDEDGFESVVAKGELESIEDPDVDTDILDGLSRVEIPLFDVFERDLREIDFEFYRMPTADITGKRELQQLD
jgi:nitroimidazol reductase NimA-like FMN-containing flavoprotein (pyridoxamine 5'-phosphate oxidase superfamily)